MTKQIAGPASLALAALVARRYYLDERSKVEIAGELGLSRFKIARLLELARETGLVRIEIGHPGLIDVDLSARIMDRFGMKHAVVVDTPDDHVESLRRHLGQVAAELLAEVIGPDDVLGVAWSRSVGAMAKALPRLPSVPVVQLTGAIAMPGGRPQLDRHRARRRPRRQRTGLRVLRAVHRARRRYGTGTAPAARRRPGVRPAAEGHQGRHRRRAVGTRSVDAVRHRRASAIEENCTNSASAPSCPASSSQPTASRSRRPWPSG